MANWYDLPIENKLQIARQMALQAGLGQDGADALLAVLLTEGGLTGAVGDQGQSRGPLQFYGGGGMLNTLAREMGMGVQDAGDWVDQNPDQAIQWAIQGYLGDAIRQGMAQGLSGPDLATYAQQYGQRSIDPWKAGQNYARIGQYNLGPATGRAPGLSSPYRGEDEGNMDNLFGDEASQDAGQGGLQSIWDYLGSLMGNANPISGYQNAGSALSNWWNQRNQGSPSAAPDLSQSPYGVAGARVGQAPQYRNIGPVTDTSGTRLATVMDAQGKTWQRQETKDAVGNWNGGTWAQVKDASSQDAVGVGNLQQRIAEFRYQQSKDAAAQLRQQGQDQRAAEQDQLAEQWKQRAYDLQQAQQDRSLALDYSKLGIERQGMERANRALYSTRGQPAAPETQMPDLFSFMESLQGPGTSFQEHLQKIGSNPNSPDILSQWNAWRGQVQKGMQPSLPPVEGGPWYQSIKGQGVLKPWRPPVGLGMPQDLGALSGFSGGEMSAYEKLAQTAGTSVNDILNAIKRRMPQRAAPTPRWGY